MGKKAIRAKKCEGKAKFERERDAWKGIERLRAATGHTALVIPYRCGFCPWWHAGHPPKKVRQELAAMVMAA